MKYDIGTSNRLGNRKSNQDRLSIVESGSAVLLVVADGMGGHACGDLAAEATVDCAIREFNNAQNPVRNPVDFVKNIILHAHHDVVTLASIYKPPLKTRTTCVICMIQEGVAYWAHVGDSRLYLIRDGAVIGRTVDHSRVEELYQQGKITEAQKHRHPERNLVTQCIGSRSYGPQPTLSEPYPLQEDDVLLLCSDGLWGALNEQHIVESVRKGDLITAVDALSFDAEHASYPHADNISVAAIRWLSSPASGAVEPDSDIDSSLASEIKNIYSMATKK